MSQLKMKFLVLKVEDIEQYLSKQDKNELYLLVNKILFERMNKGKNINQYIVVNMDESYASIVVELVNLGNVQKELLKEYEEELRKEKLCSETNNQ